MLLLHLLALASSAQATVQFSGLNWFDLDRGQAYSLTQKISLGAEANFPVGTRLVFEDSEPLSVPGAPMSVLYFREEPCKTPSWQSQLEIVVPEGNAESSSVGVELSAGCHWGIYLEDKDAFTPSFFSQN